MGEDKKGQKYKTKEPGWKVSGRLVGQPWCTARWDKCDCPSSTRWSRSSSTGRSPSTAVNFCFEIFIIGACGDELLSIYCEMMEWHMKKVTETKIWKWKCFLGSSPWLLTRIKIVIKTKICEWPCFLGMFTFVATGLRCLRKQRAAWVKDNDL